MTTAPKDPEQFMGIAENVALYLQADDVFTLLKRSIDLPSQWAAIVQHETGSYGVVPAGETVDGSGAQAVMFARISPFEVALKEEDVATRDGFSCRADVSFRISVVPEKGDLLSFMRTVMGSRSAADAQAVAVYLQPAVREALAACAKGHDVASLVNPEGERTVSAAIGEALKAHCFKAGMLIEAPPSVRLHSRAMHRVRQVREDAARRLQEHEASRELSAALRKAQTERVDHLAELLSRLTKLTEASPGVKIADLLRTFTDHERGELYAALFSPAGTASPTRWIVVAAGSELMFFGMDDLESPQRRFTLQGPVGAVRSVQPAGEGEACGALLLGAARGVYRIPLDSEAPDLVLQVPAGREVHGGFNSAVALKNRLVASHSEIGLCEWDLSQPGCPRYLFANMTSAARAVRNVQAAGEDLYCSVDDVVLRWAQPGDCEASPQVYTGSTSTITALCATAQGPYVGNSEGDVLYWPDGPENEPQYLYRGSHRAVESLHVLARAGIRRLVFADTSPRVRAQILGDSFACEYQAGGQTLRRVEVAPDIIVATSDLRDRLFCWNPAEPDRPRATLGVSRLAGRSIQDVCLV